MLFASISNVQAYAPNRLITATSIPNSSQVTMFIEDAQAEVEGILAGDGYQVPVPTTATIALSMLRRIVTLGAWAQVEQSSQNTDHAKKVLELWAQARLELAKGTLQLPDAPRLGGENFARSNPYASPFFSRDMQL